MKPFSFLVFPGLIVVGTAIVAGLGSLQPENLAMRTAAGTGPVYSRSGHDVTPLPPERVEALAAKLDPDEAKIILRRGTEAPYCGTLLDNKQEGTYVCRLCGLPLFSSGAKFDSGTGWPSFFQPVDPAHVRYESDASHGMKRTEITCARCGGHLGHVFDDAPQTPTGLRYCLNSASLEFYEGGAELPPASRPVQTATAYFAGGCFWGVEDHLQQVPGVIDAASGYMGGRTEEPSYKQVCSGETGHAETVRIVYDPARLTYRELLDWFFTIHDPTQLNRQGPDHGTQYRSAIFAASDEQLAEAGRYVEELQQRERFAGRKIVTRIEPADTAGPGRFWEAEEYHQDYHAKHGGSCPLPER